MKKNNTKQKTKDLTEEYRKNKNYKIRKKSLIQQLDQEYEEYDYKVSCRDNKNDKLY